jgi:CBS domain containing-hemolysin-like protein
LDYQGVHFEVTELEDNRIKYVTIMYRH